MRGIPASHQNQSHLPVHPQHEVGMHKSRHVQVSKKDHTLVRGSLVKLVPFLRQVLSIILAGFIIIISKIGHKAVRHSAIEQSVQGRRMSIQLEQKDQELEPATQLEDKFISMVSHELKTPMTTISGHTQLMLRRLSKLPELSSELNSIRNELERINGQTHRLNAIVDELLDLNNIRVGKIDLRIRACNLVGLCHEVVEDQQFLTNRTIELDVPKGPITLQADYEHLSQVLVNLLSNALKYSPEEALVKVSVQQENGDALIQVLDNGPGIPKEQQVHISEAFYRAPELQLSSKSGLGLGLTICKEIVERHHGHIWCDSELGKGSTFFVELPIRQFEI